jgi:hypothetical protein
LSQELLKFALLVGLFVALSKVEPGGGRSSSASSWVGLASEARLDNLLDLVDPCLLEEVRGLRDARSLDLVELINLHGLSDVGVEYVLHSNFIALLADLLLGTNHFVLYL